MANRDNIHNYPTYTGPLHKCCYCQTSFISLYFLLKHNIKCTNYKIFVALKDKFLMDKQIKDNVEKAQREKELKQLRKEKKSTQVKQEKKKRMDLQTPENSIKCTYCAKVFKKKVALLKHQCINQKDKKKMLKCKVCLKKIMCQESLEHYMISHPEVKTLIYLIS